MTNLLLLASIDHRLATGLAESGTKHTGLPVTLKKAGFVRKRVGNESIAVWTEKHGCRPVRSKPFAEMR